MVTTASFTPFTSYTETTCQSIFIIALAQFFVLTELIYTEFTEFTELIYTILPGPYRNMNLCPLVQKLKLPI